MSPGRKAGGTRQELQLDITREQPVDDNSFQGELVQLIETSINIHGEESPEGRLRFGLEENPRSKVRASAKNDKLWQPGVTAASWPDHLSWEGHRTHSQYAPSHPHP